MDSQSTTSSSDTLGPLASGQTVAIIGGGPAGASCAIALGNLAVERKIDLKVLLYEAKDFDSEHQYNQCAGVLSPPIVEFLTERLKVRFPQELVQRTIAEYLFRGTTETILLAGSKEPSHALRRVQFDRYLLGEAAKRGTQVLHERVQQLETHRRGVHVFSESSSRQVDVVVGAFGLDAGAADAFSSATAYRPPPCIETLVTKFHPPEGTMAAHGETAYAFLPPIPKVDFAAIIPKGNHLTVVVVGKKLSVETMDRVLQWNPVREIIHPEQCLEQPPQYHKGRFPAARAKGILGERYITVGDAAGLVRPFKGKGITTACLTGYRAAVTMMDSGIGEKALGNFYGQCHELVEDIRYGRAVRWLARLATRSGAVDDLVRQARTDDQLRAAMYCCVSGEGAFRTMLLETVSLGRAARTGVAIMRGGLRKLWRP